jgi:hypothetical protein
MAGRDRFRGMGNSLSGWTDNSALLADKLPAWTRWSGIGAAQQRQDGDRGGPQGVHVMSCSSLLEWGELDRPSLEIDTSRLSLRHERARQPASVPFVPCAFS